GAALAISPIHAMFGADLARFSPYGPSSRLFLNALYIDPAAVLGEDGFRAAMQDLGPAFRQALAKEEQSELIDWPEASALRLVLLRRLYDRFRSHGTREMQRELEIFRLKQGRKLEDHARFEVLHDWFRRTSDLNDWQHWPAAYRDPAGSVVKNFARQHEEDVSFHAFLQWQAAIGMASAQRQAREAGMAVGVIADMAVGADRSGSQSWSGQQEMLNGFSVGAPPDIFNKRGQNWGIGAISPGAMRANGFQSYVAMLRAAFAHAGGVRIDHALGLARLWLVPDGVPAGEGAYFRYPLADLQRLIALESWRHRAIVIGENLGTVPEGFNDELARVGLLGTQVLLFQRDHAGFLPPQAWSSDSIATTTTHDLPTIAGWWKGRDIDWQVKLDRLPSGMAENEIRQARLKERNELLQAIAPADIQDGTASDIAETPPMDAVASFVAATPAPLVILPIEDALGLTEQANLPDTIDAHPNWRRRLPEPVDTILQLPNVRRRLVLLDQRRRARGMP
ncbi:MAG: 4-alpha-glucanotransferase, partial [Burkholderiaceae bacterium]|nr:4-alpha-glucanotransferase [Burkholderiaceae bacterium]